MEERWSRWDKRGYVALVSRLTSAAPSHLVENTPRLCRFFIENGRMCTVEMHFSDYCWILIPQAGSEPAGRFDSRSTKRTHVVDWRGANCAVDVLYKVSDFLFWKVVLSFVDTTLYDLVYELSSVHASRFCGTSLSMMTKTERYASSVIFDMIYANWKMKSSPRRPYPGVIAFLSCLVQQPQDLFDGASKIEVILKLTRRRLQWDLVLSIQWFWWEDGISSFGWSDFGAEMDKCAALSPAISLW